jgi:uncharacterized membrane protein HdeD (DUF308 family)
MSATRAIPLSVHGVIEIVGAAALIAAPFLLGFGTTTGAASLALGVTLMGLALATHTDTRTLPLSAHAAFDYLLGALMLIAGAFQIVHAFSVRGWGRFAWWLLSGILYALAGIFAFMNPILASTVLTLLLAAALLAAGVIRIWIGFEHRSEANWGWVVAAGVVTALAGVIIALGWPVNSLFVLGIFLAIDLLFQGATLTALGFALRR